MMFSVYLAEAVNQTAEKGKPLLSPVELLIFLVFVGVVFGSLILYHQLYMTKTKSQREKLMRDMMLRAYNKLSKFFLTKTYLEEVRIKVGHLSVFRKDEIKIHATKMVLVAWSVSILLVTAGLLFFENTLIIILFVGFAFIFTNLYIDRRLDKAYEQVLRGASYAYDAVRQEFSRTNSIVDALNDAEYPDIVRKPMDEIYTILTSTNSNQLLQNFKESTPFRSLQTFATICYLIEQDGDTKDVFGRSNFSQALTMLISDINSEIQKIQYRKIKFGKKEIFPLVSLLAIPVIISVFGSMMSGTMIIYNGVIGQLIQTVCILSGIYSYMTISRLNMSKTVIEDDRMEFIEKLLLKKHWKQFAMNISPKNKKRAKVELSLKNAMSRMSVEHLYLRKFLFATVAGVVVFLTIFVSLGINDAYMRSSTAQLSLVSSNDSPAYDKEAMKKMDKIFLENPDDYTSDEQMTELVRAHLPLLTDLQIVEELKRLNTKKGILENNYFKWYYIWIVFATVWIGWMWGSMTIRTRKKVMQAEAKEDFLQLQTLTSILMYTGMDTLDLIGELAKNSVVHRQMLEYAYHEYPSNADLALSRLRAKVGSYDFKRYIDKLKLTTSELELPKAFDSLLTEREHILKLREMEIMATINQKARRAGRLSLTPLVLIALGLYLFPMGYLGAKELFTGITSM